LNNSGVAGYENVKLERGHRMGDKAKNKAEEVKGSAQKKVGRATGDREMESEGRTEQAKSNVKQAGEKAKDAVKGVTKRS
jgi:uncharacterized protein YjbJ (UPF0337 family)